MKSSIAILASAFIASASVVAADVTELSQAQLRSAVAQDRAIPTRSLVAGVENFTGGEVVDIRAFLDGSTLVYRILYRSDDGTVGSLLVDGGTGRAIAEGSQTGQSIAAYVTSNPGQGNGQGNAFGRTNNNGSNGIGNGRNNGNNGRGNDNRGGGGGNSGGGNSGGKGGGRDR